MTLSTEHELLVFLWRWKLCSASALYVRFFAALRPISAYMRLEKLRSRGFIRQHCDGLGQKTLWTLNKIGFACIQPLLPELAEEGWLSEAFMHDHFVSAFHLGEWLGETPEGCAFFSEQELRRFHPEHYPVWVPPTRMHRPDGYWHINAGAAPQTVALEVELSRKSKETYLLVNEFYQSFAQIDAVIWIVSSLAQAQNLQSHFETWGEGTKYQYLILQHVLEQGWQAPVILGTLKGECLSKILIKNTQKSAKEFYVPALLYGKKFPRKQEFIRRRSNSESAIDPY